MNDAAVPDLTLLRAYVAADAYARLVAGNLPAAQIQAECERLRAELAAIATYIPSGIVREQLFSPQAGRISGAYWDGSVLFADMSGFTALSERLSALGKQGAEEISAIINRLFSALLDELHHYQGSLLKFGGDALTAFFDATTLGNEHALLATGAALAMQARMNEFAALATRGGTFRLGLRIGVHSGRVFAAQVGSLEHMELVVTGHNIHRVAEAQEIAEPGEVVVSAATHALLPAAHTRPRRQDFHVVSALPPLPPIPPTPRGQWGIGRGDLRELHELAARLDALRRYLPHHLPHRFLATSDSAATGEYRPVTTLFANFYPFSAALDAYGDDTAGAARTLNAYYERAQDVIHRYGGIVNKVDMYTHGDKLMALFGAPIVHEDDPERATRAALELRDMLVEVNAEVAALIAPTTDNRPPTTEDSPAVVDSQSSVVFEQKIGLNTGVVFAGRVGSTERHEYTVMGQHVNLAARLMAAAGANTIVLSPTTRRAVEHAIDLRELAPVSLKGVAAPVPIVEAVRPRDVSLVMRGMAQAPLVGRSSDMAQIIAEGNAALRGHGRIVALVGEAGTGKTRLIESALQQLILQTGDQRGLPAFFPYHVECQSYEQNTPYATIRELLCQLFNIVPHMSPAPIQRRVAELAPDLARFTPLLRDLTGVPLEDTPLTAALTPEQRHARTEELISALLLGEAREQPLVLIVDDIHWADASSLDLLAHLARQIADAPMLMLFGYRTEPAVNELWNTLPNTTRLHIRELTPEDSVALVEALLHHAPPAELAALIERAQGNPFFIEEVVHELIESGALVRNETGWQLTRALDEAAVPDSIEGVITARLDRLDERSREVVQNASVIGRRFPYSVLWGVIVRRDDLPDRLARLAESNLIQADDDAGTVREQPNLSAYLFRQALTRDVAYEAILYVRRRDLHRRVAQQIEQLYSAQLDDQLALLARHYLLAEVWEPAFDYHLRAGRQAQARYANREAIALLERALAIIQRFSSEKDGGPRTKDESSDDTPHPHSSLVVGPSSAIEIHERLGAIRMLIGEYDAAMQHYEAALEKLRAGDDAPLDDIVRLHHHIARVHEKRADFDTAFAWVERGLALAGTAESVEVVRCLLLGAGLHQRLGRYHHALEWGERALTMAELAHTLPDQAEALMLLGGTYRNQGDNSRAFDVTNRCLAIYEQLQDVPRLGDAYNNLANICHELGLLAEAQQYYKTGADIKLAIGDVYGQAMIANNLGDLLRSQGDMNEAIKHYTFSLDIFDRLHSVYASAVLHMNLGATYVELKNTHTAEQHLTRSAELFNQSESEDFLAELERYLAELYLELGELARARMHCDRSLDIAARLEARVEEGVARRTRSRILARERDVQAAWHELEQSLAILRATAYPHQIASTLVAMAELAPQVNQHPRGQSALDEAVVLLHQVGAQRDLHAARQIATRYAYRIDDNL